MFVVVVCGISDFGVPTTVVEVARPPLTVNDTREVAEATFRSEYGGTIGSSFVVPLSIAVGLFISRKNPTPRVVPVQ